MEDFRLARALRKGYESSCLRDKGNYLIRGSLFQAIAKLKPRRKFTRPKIFSPRLAIRKHQSQLSTVTALNEGRDIIEEAWELVEEAKNNIIFDPKYSEATLIVGNTGTGKSTLAQFIAGDMSKMWAVEYPEFSGNLIIQDEDGKISKPGEESTSKTLYPELVVSTKKDSAYYDCPGFQDSRGTAVDLAGAYMTKMVFENLEKIKVHITVEWETAIGQNGRGAPFVEAIKRVGEFIRDANKFKNGFSMVATKVPKVTREDEEGNEMVVSDEVLIQSVGDFIVRNMIPDVEKKIKDETNEKKKKILENTLVIFTALSKLTDGKYSRIGLFRKPQKTGSLDKSPLMLKSRDGILNAIRTETAFMAVSTDDFGISVSDTTKLAMRDISKELNGDISKNMKEISASINTEVETRMRTSCDWVQLITSLTEVLGTVKANADRLKALEKFTQDFVNTMQFQFTTVGIVISTIKFQALKDDISYLEFLEAMLEENVSTVPENTFDNSITFTTQAVAWYKILYQFLEALSEDYIQEDTTRYNVADLDDWGNTDRPQGLRVSAQTFEKFAKLLKVETIAIDGFKLNEERMNELNSVVILTLATASDIIVKSDGTLLAQGPFIRMSKVLEKYKSNESKVSFFNVNASCAVYIDTPTLTAPGRHMIIAAPTWHIIGTTSINLDGKTGESESSPAEPGKGANPGEKGKPGGPGQPAGHFLGVADNVFNGKLLTISANGGNGGKGQDGGRGGNGSQGNDAYYPSDKWKKTPYGERDVDWKQVRYWDEWKIVYWVYYYWFDIFNSVAATDGKSGGDGGIGGYAGSKGNINLTIFEGTSGWPIVRNSDGKPGNDGAGGEGGDKAKHGNDMKAQYWYTTVALIDTDSEWSRLEWYNKGYSSSGPKGITGGNEKDRKPEIPQLPESAMSGFLIDFKGFILDVAAKTPLLRSSLNEMLRKINDTSDLNALYNPSAFLYEMNTLESQFYGIYRRMNLAPFYNLLLTNVRAYADEKKNETKQVDKLALGTIYSSCLSKLCSLQLEYKAQTFIIDLASYIDITLRRVNEIENMDRRVAVKGFQESYNQAIKLKVKEANELIATKVNPAIDKSMRGMDDVLENLVEETLKKLEEAEATKEELMELQSQMEKNVFIRGILNLLSLGGTIAGFFGPMGAAVSAVVTGGTTIIGSLVVDPNVPGGSTILLPPGVETTIKGLGDLVVSIRDRKIKELEAQLTSTEKTIAKSFQALKLHFSLKES